MKKRWLFGLLVLSALGIYFLWPRPTIHPERAEVSPERTTLKIITGTSARNPAPTKPVTEGRKPVPSRESATKRKIPQTKAERAEWAQSVRAEMKVSLAAAYGGEKSFFSEYNRYSTDLNSIGYSPYDVRELPFKVGFIRAFNPPGKPTSPTEGSSHPVLTLDDLDQYRREQARANGEEPKPLTFTESAQGVKIEDAAQYCQSECTASETGFEAIAVANLDDDPDLDVWLINDKKELRHIHDDLAP